MNQEERDFITASALVNQTAPDGDLPVAPVVSSPEISAEGVAPAPARVIVAGAARRLNSFRRSWGARLIL